MFEQLPETIPHKNKRKLETFGAAFAFQAVLVAALIVLQMAMPEKLGEFQLLTTLYMAPPPPPPAVPLSAAPKPEHHAQPNEAVVSSRSVVEERPKTQEQPTVVAPTTIPKDIARIIESGSPDAGQPGAVSGGVRGGVPGGVPGGVFGGVLGGAEKGLEVPPPPPTGPVRVEATSSHPRSSTLKSRNILPQQKERAS
jgi:hypothetical protein